MYTHVHIYLSIYLSKGSSLYLDIKEIFIYIYIYIYIYICMYVCMYVCIG